MCYCVCTNEIAAAAGVGWREYSKPKDLFLVAAKKCALLKKKRRKNKKAAALGAVKAVHAPAKYCGCNNTPYDVMLCTTNNTHSLSKGVCHKCLIFTALIDGASSYCP